jgi:hypothetical protein
MASKIHPTNRARRYRFDSQGCLYRDFGGRRVVVDAEGEGEIFSVPTNPELTLVRDGFESKEFPLLFRDSLVGTLSGSEPVETWALFGEPLAEPLEWRKAGGSLAGAGWLKNPQARVMLDDSHEWLEAVPDGLALPFFKSVRTEGSWDHAVADVACELADAWDIDDEAALKGRGWKVQNISRLRELDSRFEDGAARRAQVASHLNVAAWRSPIPPKNEGLILRKIFDRFHGRQRARVTIDGELAGVWYEPGENRDQRWAISDYGVAAELTRGKSSIEIAVSPTPGTALWSVSRTEIFALVAR